MIYIYVSMIGGEELPPRERAERESRLARELLFSAMESELSLPPAEILKEEGGKPYFATEGYPAFSIAHSAGLIAVALTRDFAKIGVDIEPCARLCNTRISDRFFAGLEPCNGEIGQMRLVYDGATRPCGREDMPAVRFTLGEAVIKCDGGGFAVAANAAALSEKMKRASLIIKTDRGEAALSVAVLD